MEGDFHRDFNRNGFSVFERGVKPPGTDGLDGLFIKAHPNPVHDSDVAWHSVGSYDDFQYASALVSDGASLLGKLWLALVSDSRRSDVSSDFLEPLRCRRRIRLGAYGNG